MFILISRCLSIQCDLLSCLLAIETKKKKKLFCLGIFFTKKSIKILCIYVSLYLDEMLLNISIIDIGMIPVRMSFMHRDPHSLKIPCRLLVRERKKETMRERRSQLTWQQ